MKPKEQSESAGARTQTKQISLSLTGLRKLIDKAATALSGDSNDAEHDALSEIREELAYMISKAPKT